MMETQFSPQIYVIPQKLMQPQKQSLLKLASPPPLVPAAPKYRVILSDPSKANKIQIAKSKPVATVVGCKRPAASVSPLSPAMSLKDIKEEEEEDDLAAPMRKRANLDHLSPEERLQRRKLKNRVAAQNARDKKKAQTEEMEKMIEEIRMEKQKLVDENARLQAANKHLQMRNASLVEENAEFRHRLGLVSVETETKPQPAELAIELPPSPASLPPLSPAMSPVSPMSSSVCPSSTVEPPESAVLTNEPLLQEQGPTTPAPQAPPPGLSSPPDLTPWVQGCVVLVSCALVTLMTILRPSSATTSPPSPPPPSLSPSPPHTFQLKTKLPLKKRNWDCWSHHPPRY